MANIFQEDGRPLGYGQIAPGRDQRAVQLALRGGPTSQRPGYGPAATNAALGVGAGIAARTAANAAPLASRSLAGAASGYAGGGSGTVGAVGGGGSRFGRPGGMNPYYGMGIGMATDYAGGKLKPQEHMPTYGGPHADITDRYGRRFEGAGPGSAGGFVRGAGYGTQVWPGVGTVIGGLAGLAVGAATRNAPSAFSDFSATDAGEAVADAYRRYLGREAAPDEVMGHLVGQGYNYKRGDRWVGEKGLFSVLDAIASSPEAQAYAAQSGTGGLEKGPSSTKVPNPDVSPTSVLTRGTEPQATYNNLAMDPDLRTEAEQGFGGALGAGGGPAGQSDIEQAATNQALGTWQGIQPVFRGGKPGGSSLEGFNTGRAFNSEDPDSVKDAFARAAGDSGLNLSNMSKDQVQAALEAEIVPLLRAQGIQVDQVVGDKIHAFTKERGWEWIDVVRNAGGGADQAFQWLPDADNQAAGGGAGSMGPGAGTPGRAELARILGIDPSNPILDQIMQGLTQGALRG